MLTLRKYQGHDLGVLNSSYSSVSYKLGVWTESKSNFSGGRIARKVNGKKRLHTNSEIAST